MGEGDAETATALFAGFVIEAGLVALAQFAGDIQPEAGAFVLVFRREERFEDLANDLAVKFKQDNVLFQMFCAEMQQFELNLSFMPIDFSFDHSGVDHHYDSAFDHNNFNNTF